MQRALTVAPMLEWRNVSKKFDRAFALDTISLSATASKTLVLLGTSGCGKSTLLKLALGLVEPDSGHVLMRDEPVTPKTHRKIRRLTGYVIQNAGLFPHLSALDNIALVARSQRWSTAAIARRVGELAELARFPADHLQRFPAELSGGLQQRVGLIRALMLNPDLLLMDEPLAALDPITRFDLQCDLKQIFQNLGKTVVWVTHDLSEAAFFADEIALLHQGRLVQRGTFAALLRSPAEPFVTRFVNAHRLLPPLGTD